jgi:hypothetical protein
MARLVHHEPARIKIHMDGEGDRTACLIRILAPLLTHRPHYMLLLLLLLLLLRLLLG